MTPTFRLALSPEEISKTRASDRLAQMRCGGLGTRVGYTVTGIDRKSLHSNPHTCGGPGGGQGEVVTSICTKKHFRGGERVRSCSTPFQDHTNIARHSIGKVYDLTFSLYPSGRSCRFQKSYSSFGRPVSVVSQPGSWVSRVTGASL